MTPARENRKPVPRDDGHENSPPPLPFSSPDHPLQLGWPFAQYADALLKHDAAKRREWAATVTRDVNARERAILDKLEAQTERQQIRDSVAHLFIFALRVALEDDHGETLRTLLQGVLGLDQFEARLNEVEDGVLALNRGEVLT